MTKHDGINGTSDTHVEDHAAPKINLTAELREMVLTLDAAIDATMEQVDDHVPLLPAMMQLQGMLAIAMAVDKLSSVVLTVCMQGVDHGAADLAEMPVGGHA